MRGYWKRPEDTFKTLDPEGWLSTGDQADILPGNYLKIKGRIKEIIVTSTGEKVPLSTSSKPSKRIRFLIRPWSTATIVPLSSASSC